MVTLYQFLPQSVDLIHATIAVIALSRQTNTTQPLILSLALDISSRYLRRTPPPSSTLERAEYARRDRDLLWYFFRGPIWSSYTRYIVSCYLICRLCPNIY